MAKKEDSQVVVNDPFAIQLMVRYLDNRKQDIRALRAALANEDFESIRDKGHNLFGSGSAYGLDRVSELGMALEKTAKKKNSDDIGQLIEMLEAFIANVQVVQRP